MKKFKSILSIIAVAILSLVMFTSCLGWYDFFDDPYGPPPPPPPPHHYHHYRY